MEPPDPSFADEFNVPQEDAVLVFDVRRAAVSLPFSSACFEFANGVQKKLSTAALRTFRRFFPAIFCEVLRVSVSSHPLCCHDAFISASTPGPAHQPCAPRSRLERGTNSAAGESMTSAMSVAMSPIQVPSGIGGSASTIAFATWHRRFGSVINRSRSASFGVSLVLSLFLRFGADLRGMRTFAYTRL